MLVCAKYDVTPLTPDGEEHVGGGDADRSAQPDDPAEAVRHVRVDAAGGRHPPRHLDVARPRRSVNETVAIQKAAGTEMPMPSPTAGR